MGHISIEHVLSKHFEKDFPKHYKVVMDMLAEDYEIGKPISNPQEVIDAVKIIVELGFTPLAFEFVDLLDMFISIISVN